MTELLTAQQMRAVEQQAIAAGEVTGLALMERAGRGAVDAILAHWPALCEGRQHAVVLCGPGNNGGDGFVVARRLRDKGWDVEVFFWGNAARLSADARKNHDVWAAMGEVHPLTPERAGEGPRPVLLVDAMFGTGLNRAIPLELAKAFHAVEQREAGGAHPWFVPFHKVALDCPSGMDSDSGKFLLPPRPEEVGDEDETFQKLHAWLQDDASMRLLNVDLTLTFHRRKIAHALGEGVGDVRVVDIGLGLEDLHPAHLALPRSSQAVTALEFEAPHIRTRSIWPGRELDKGHGLRQHKFDHGHALVLSGSAGKTGAARMAARGALRIGAGLVTLGVPRGAKAEVAAQITGLMQAKTQDADELAEILQDKRINALCLGPGMGRKRARKLVPVALGAAHEPRVVLDADALSAFSEVPEELFGLLHAGCVLTPHGGEFARLFPDVADRLHAPALEGPAYSKIDATRDAAKRAGCVVLFKGAETVIAAADGRCSVNIARGERAAPWLATAGAGDVLAGFITGLLARGYEPFATAEVAAWLHVECARAFGPGLIAEDLPEILPSVLRDLL
ncbi:NAD(P)H-hydrate dehydratase [Sulfitobacter sp.]|uniref:NAD(P)H-hydrate dehydratase n=1 Tax=Sulfitobacter sp. TaxID=1903071 RepID=UPI0030014595